MNHKEIVKRLQWLKDNVPYGSDFIGTIDKDYRGLSDHDVLSMNISAFASSKMDAYGKKETGEVLSNANKLFEHLNLRYPN
jgi:hypothetical protein